LAELADHIHDYFEDLDAQTWSLGHFFMLFGGRRIRTSNSNSHMKWTIGKEALNEIVHWTIKTKLFQSAYDGLSSDFIIRLFQVKKDNEYFPAINPGSLIKMLSAARLSDPKSYSTHLHLRLESLLRRSVGAVLAAKALADHQVTLKIHLFENCMPHVPHFDDGPGVSS